MPRKPGGKYKGAVKRTKGEETLQAEAEERGRKARELAVQRAAELKARQLTAGHGLKSSKEEEEEAKKQRIINMLVGGKKDAKKYFQNWIVGIRQVKKERAMEEREGSWRFSCGCPPGPHSVHQCQAYHRLRSSDFQMPFDRQNEIEDNLKLMSQTSVSKNWAAGSRGGLNNTMGSTMGSSMESTNGGLRNTMASLMMDKATKKQLARSSSTGGQGFALPSLGNAVNTLGKSMSAANFMKKQDHKPKEPWFEETGKNTELEYGYHHSSGRRILLDRKTMRFKLLPVENEAMWDPHYSDFV